MIFKATQQAVVDKPRLCVRVRPGEFDVLVNDGNEAIYEVEAITSHHRYQPETYDNDIALMKLTKPIKFSRFILPACLPEQNFAEKVNTD